MVDTADRLLPVEVKATGSPDPSDARHLRTFLEEYPDLTDGALLLHGGEEVSSGSPRGSWPPRGGA